MGKKKKKHGHRFFPSPSCKPQNLFASCKKIDKIHAAKVTITFGNRNLQEEQNYCTDLQSLER